MLTDLMKAKTSMAMVPRSGMDVAFFFKRMVAYESCIYQQHG